MQLNLAATENYRAWLKTITYKPDWAFEIVEFDEVLEQGPAIHLINTTLDCCETNSTIEVVHRRLLPPYEIKDINTFIEFVFAQITSAEQHETEEWFTVNGKRMFNPHKNIEGIDPTQTRKVSAK